MERNKLISILLATFALLLGSFLITKKIVQDRNSKNQAKEAAEEENSVEPDYSSEFPEEVALNENEDEEDLNEDLESEADLESEDGEEEDALESDNLKSILFVKDQCPECQRAEDFINKNNTEEIEIERRNINQSQRNYNGMLERAALCEIERSEIKIPLLWVEGECYLGEAEITDFFKEDAWTAEDEDDEDLEDNEDE